jgi:hypothetical protein
MLVRIYMAILYESKSVKFQGTPVQIQIQTNPLIAAKISIDGQVFTAPTTVNLAPGQHKFSAVSKVPYEFITYGFDCWELNGKTVSYMATALITITGACTVTAQYMLAESGVNAPASPDSLPNPQGPLTPNLVLENPFKET